VRRPSDDVGTTLSLLRAGLKSSFEPAALSPSVNDSALDSLRRHTASTLRSRPDTEACATVCRHAVAVIEVEVAARRADGAPIACAPGCAFCCHQRVGVYAHEALALLRQLRALPRADAAAIEARIVANARAVDALTVEQHRAANLRCAFLVDGRCAAYEVRPSACARYHSLSRARCEHAFDHPQDVGTPRNSRPALAELQAFGDAVAAATEAALADAGLAASKGELHQLLRALLEDPSLIERWSAGDDVATASGRADSAPGARAGALTRS
jgi:Fe-S-cluster containining protein